MENQIKKNKGNFIEDSILIKAAFVILVAVLLLIPVESVKKIIRERNGRHLEATNEISSKWGEKQLINAIVLTIPYDIYTTIYTNKEKTEYEIKAEKRFAHFLPQNLNISGDIKSQVRYRGIFNAVVYSSNLNIQGQFEQPDFSEWKIGVNEQRIIRWNEAFVSLGISDLSAVQEEINFKWNSKKLPFEPIDNYFKQILNNSNLSSNVLVVENDTAKESYNFNLDLKFNGSNSLKFIPLGKTTTVKIESDWKDPKFDGTFLPDNREITDAGFNADWKILQINRNFPQKFKGAINNISNSAFGVKLIIPVDKYLKSMRAVKYAILLISLTFLSFFFIQILRKVKIHPLQYLLVGFALSLFYILLVSISEHTTFNIAYLIASTATIILIAIYVKKIFSDKSLWKILTAILSVLYIFIFTILQLQEYSLLMGSIGLFIILTTIMYMSRNIDWYNITNKNEAENLE